MSQTTMMILLLAAVLGIAIAWMYSRQKRSKDLQAHFGPEYDRLVHQKGTPGRAEAELEERAARVKQLAIRPLPPDLSTRYAKRWTDQQTRFVDEPNEAVVEADHLVEEVMRERGYPVGEFDQLAADISVEHPRLVNNYRAAHEISLRQQRGQATTEDLREAMVYYRDLFRELLDEREPLGATNR